jgi:hypothetical protein
MVHFKIIEIQKKRIKMRSYGGVEKLKGAGIVGFLVLICVVVYVICGLER